MEEKGIVSFESKEIRKIWYNEEWHFSVVDVIEILTDSRDPKNYWSKLKERDPQTLTVCQSLKMLALDGKMRKTDCANTEGVFRIIMSVPSPKAEPLKLWMAQVSKERIEETENPELSFERMTEIYKAKGRSEEWIRERFQSIEARKRLTDEWKARGVKEGHEYSILTATIAKGTFGLTPNQHGQLKGLEKQNLRDHMTPLELIFTSLGEEVTRQIAINEDAKGFNANHEAAELGGSFAGNSRIRLEKERGVKVISTESFLSASKDEKQELPPDEKK